MKHFLLKSLLTAMLAICCISAYAYDFKVGSFYYNLVNSSDPDCNEVVMVEGTSKNHEGAIEIPATVEYRGKTYGVIEIGDWAFYGCNGITEVKINEGGIKSIISEAFSYCNNLQKVILPNSVTSIGAGVFKGCFNLTEINLEEGLLEIGADAFAYCASLSTITVPSSVMSIQERAFNNCTNLAEIKLQEGLQTIGNGAFLGCASLSHFELPSTITSIGFETFQDCSLQYVKSHIPAESLFEINGDEFGNCQVLYVPNGAKETYANTAGWNKFAEIIEMEDTQSHLAQSISLDYESFTLAPEKTIQLTATVLPETAENKSVTWTSSNDEVATVWEGYVTSHAIGTAVITATTQDGSNLSASCTITVAVPETPDGAEELVEYVHQNFPNGIDLIGGDWPGSYDLASVEALRAVYARYEAYILGENNEDPSVILQDFETAMNNLVWNYIKEGYYFIQPQRPVNGHLGLVTDRNGNIGSEVYKNPETIASITAEDAKYIWYFKPVTEAEETATFGDCWNYAFHIQNVYTKKWATNLLVTASNGRDMVFTTGDVPGIYRAFHDAGSTFFYTHTENGFCEGVGSCPYCASWNQENGGSNSIIKWNDTSDPANYFNLYNVATEDVEAIMGQIEQNKKNEVLQDLVDEALKAYEAGFSYVPTADCTFDDDFSNPGLLNSAENLLIVDQNGNDVVHPTDGAGNYGGLTDNNANTYVHTKWNDTSFPHYFVVDLGEGNELDAIALKVMRRINTSVYNAEFCFGEVKVYGRKDDYSEWKKVGNINMFYNINLNERDENGNVVTDDLGNPTLHSWTYGGATLTGENYVGIGTVGFDDKYRYICFEHYKTNGGTTNTYFCAAEMAVYGAVYDAEGSVNTHISQDIKDRLLAELASAKSQLEAGTATDAQINALRDAYNAYLTAEPGGNPGEGGNEDGDDNEDNPAVDTNPANYDNVIYGENINTRPGEDFVLPIMMRNTEDIVSFQFDLYLPEGFSIKLDEYGDEFIELDYNRANQRRHSWVSKKQEDGAVRIACYSSSENVAFIGNEGCVMNITLVADESLSDGDYEVAYKGIVMAKSDVSTSFNVDHVVSNIKVKKLIGDVNGDNRVNILDVSGIVSLLLGTDNENLDADAADANNDGKINVLDVSIVVDILLNGQPTNKMSEPAMRSTMQVYSAAETKLFVDPFTILPGEEKEVLVNLNNPNDEITSVEFDLYLPEGIEVLSEEEDGDIYYEMEPGSRAHRSHKSVQAAKQEDGAIKVILYSDQKKSFKGNAGDIIAITLKAADNMASGTYNIELKNQVICSMDLEDVASGNTSCIVTVGDATSINAINTNMERQTIYDLYGRPTDAKQRGIYIVGGKKILK